MDKRSLLFFLLVTSSFLFVNHYFSSKSIEKNKVALEQAQSVRKAQILQVQKEAKSKTASLTDISLTGLYSSKDGDLLAYAASVGDQKITLAWADEVPNKLYDGNKYTNLAFKNQSKSEPILYSTSNKKLSLPRLPDYDGAEFQFLSFNQEPKLIFAKQIDGEIVFAEELSSNAIAFTRYQNEYLPVGVYDIRASKIRPLNEYISFKEHLEIKEVKLGSKSRGEEFYVLENDYQMLVFSTKGGALAEINLPFETKENQNSVVKEINFDRDMKEQHPQEDYFPQNGYHLATHAGSAFVDQGELGGYYPLIRRSIGEEEKPSYYSMSVVGDNAENMIFNVTRFEKNLIEFTSSQAHRRITKTFTLPEDSKNAPYIFNLKVTVEGDARDLWLNSGVPEVELISGASNPALKYRVTRGTKSSVEKLSLPEDKPGKDSILVSTVAPDWIANSNGFLGIIMDPLSDVPAGLKAKILPGIDIPTRLSLIDAKYNKYPVKKFPGYELFLPLKSNQTMEFRIFAGPFEDDVLTIIDEHFDNPAAGYNPDYKAAQSFHGWFSFVSAPFSKFLFLLMKLFHSVTGSWGLSIILLTLALRIMLYPLNAWSIKSTARMQEVGPEIKKIQEKYKKDKQRQQLEMMKLYKEKGANPFMGCFPMLIQLPFLIGMFDLLKSTFELRGAIFVPGWITNLTQPDILFSWGYPIIFFGTSFHLLPILLGGAMYAQQKYTAHLSGNQLTGELTDQQKQQKMMGNVLPIVMTVLFYHFASGLNIYWLSSTLFGMAQQRFMKSKMKAKETKPAVKLKRQK